MAPLKKKPKISEEGRGPSSALLSDCRAGWLINAEQSIDLVANGEVLVAHRDILTCCSEYFKRCLENTWIEGQKGSIAFDDVDPSYLALFIGLAYSHSSIVSLTPPTPQTDPQPSSKRTPIKDLIEVHKLCDRFICPTLADYIVGSIYTSIIDAHRTLFRFQLDTAHQKAVMREFADAYESLGDGAVHKAIASTLIQYFCEGVDFDAWGQHADEIADRMTFVVRVSQEFARKLKAQVEGRKMKRRELKAAEY